MTRIDPNVELTLELARSAHEPSAADKLRVFEALRARVGAPAAGAAGETLRPGGGASRTPAFAKNAALHQLILVGAVTGVVGFFLGSSFNPAPRTEPTARPPSVEAAPASEPARAFHPPPSTGGPPDPEPQKPQARMGAEQPARSRAPGQARPHRVAMSDPQFLEAVRLLQRAQRSLDGAEPAFAMALLDELDARFPRELLNEERQATRVLALCASGETDRARRAAEALAAQTPSSIYAARIQRSCVGSSQSAPRGR